MVTSNTWTHFGLVYNGSGTFTFYFNGSLVYTRSSVTTVSAPSGSVLTLGRFGYSGGVSPAFVYFTGNMADFRAYKTNLSAIQIQQIYNSTVTTDLQPTTSNLVSVISGIDTSNLQLWFPFNEGT